MAKICGIYKITSPSGRVYIGQSMDIKNRFNSYKQLTCKQQPKLYRSLKKYGVDAHIFEIIEECKYNDLNFREGFWQKYYNSVENGLNCILNLSVSGEKRKPTCRQKRFHTQLIVIFIETKTILKFKNMMKCAKYLNITVEYLDNAIKYNFGIISSAKCEVEFLTKENNYKNFNEYFYRYAKQSS